MNGSTPVERLLDPLHRFAKLEAAGGIVLLVATAVAMLWANSAWSDSYHLLWEVPLSLRVGGWGLDLSLHAFINDALMAVFFFVVGLEIKREMMVGELRSPRKAALPLAGALGGMLVPALIYSLWNAGGAGSAGWGIPMATDIAFAVGILTLVGSRAPLALKVFLTALAIADDLGAVLVIAMFYTSELNLGALALSGLLLGVLLLLNRLAVRHAAAYGLLGVGLWLAVLGSGVHATVAGVLLALTVPARTRIDTAQFLESSREFVEEFDRAGVEGKDVMTNEGQQNAIQKLEAASEKAQAPLMRFEHSLAPWVSFAIIPLFALSNAGVQLGGDLGAAFSNPVTIGVLLGLVLGKPIGITLFAWLATRFGLAALPSGVSWGSLHAVAWLGGIGFTMSLFVAGLAFGEGSPLLDSAKIGILGASALAALVGWLLLKRQLPVMKDES